MPQIPNARSAQFADIMADRADRDQRRMEALDASTELVMFVRPWRNGLDQPLDVKRVKPELAEQYSISNVAIRITQEQAQALRPGLTLEQAMAAMGLRGLQPVVKPGQPIPVNLAPPLAARPRDAEMLSMQLETAEAVARIEAQDRLGTIDPATSIAARSAAVGAGQNVKAAAQARMAERAARLQKAGIEVGEAAGMRDPLAEATPPGVAADAGPAASFTAPEQSADAMKVQEGGEPQIPQAPDPLAEAAKLAEGEAGEEAARKAAAARQGKRKAATGENGETKEGEG